MKSVLALLLFLSLTTVCLGFRKQKYHIKGTLMCGDRPARDVKVKLVDEDDGPDPDDKMKDGRTNNRGFFELSGSTRELSTIEPRFKIYHDCDDGIKPGQRKWKVHLPEKYINKGVLDIGVWNLEVRLMDEERNHF